MAVKPRSSVLPRTYDLGMVSGRLLDFYGVCATILSATSIAGVLEIRYIRSQGYGVVGLALSMYVTVAVAIGATALAGIPDAILGEPSWIGTPNRVANASKLAVAMVVSLPLGLTIGDAIREAWDAGRSKRRKRLQLREVKQREERLARTTSTKPVQGWSVGLVLAAVVSEALRRATRR